MIHNIATNLKYVLLIEGTRGSFDTEQRVDTL